MPATVTELYHEASNAMLARGGVVSNDMRSLLEAVFFQAHIAEQRVIEDVQLMRAMLAVFDQRTTHASNSEIKRLPEYQQAVDSLPSEAHEELEAMKARVKDDKLPLLSLMQIDPLQMQSSHLSFQEYFAACAICSEKYRLPKGSRPPWQWSAFWANAVKLGGEMGDAFGCGLMRTAGLEATLNLNGKLRGDRPTTIAVVAELVRALTSLDLSSNNLSSGEGAKIAERLKISKTLTALKYAAASPASGVLSVPPSVSCRLSLAVWDTIS